MWVPLTPLEFYRSARGSWPERTAVVDDGERFSFAAFGARVERLAGALSALGLKPREAVSVVAPNTHHLLEAFYGVPLAGGVIHPVNPRQAPMDLASRINEAGSRILLFHASAAAGVVEVLGNLKAIEHLVLIEGDPSALGVPALAYETMLERAEPYAPDLSSLDEQAPLAMLPTSGTAAAPRLVLLSHRALALHALRAAHAMGLRETDVSLCSVPFSHMNGGGNPQLNLAVGATSVMARDNDPQSLVSLLQREAATVWITAPVVLRRVLRSHALGEGGLRTHLRLSLVGGGPIGEMVLIEAEERLGGRFVPVYGLTEAAPFVSGAFHRGTGQRPILGVEVRIADESGHGVPADGVTQGEVLVRGGGLMSGYHRDPEATQEALGGGWLHTGDLAVAAPDGTFTLRGRQKDVVLVEGRAVASREVEIVILAHPGVRECAVVAGADPERGEVPVALVVLRPGARLTEHELIEHARYRLAPFKVPARVEFLPSLPRTDSGEIVKSELRTQYAHA